MKPDEKKMQERKIRLMQAAMIGGIIGWAFILYLLAEILRELRTISMLFGISNL